MLYVGIDQHRKQLTVHVRDDQGEVLLRRQVSTQWDKVREFLDDLDRRATPTAGYFAIVEVCGFNDWLLQHLRARQPVCRQVFLIQPEQQASHKTDRRDAAGLSEQLWLNRERLLARRPARGLRVVCQPSAEDLFDRRLTSRRVVSSHDLTRTINRIKAILRRHNVEQECPTKGLGTLKSLAWLKRLELPGVDRLEMNQMLRRWELLKCERQELDDQIAQRQKQNRAAIILATIPGIAAYGALALASRIGDIRRFPRPRSLANYWGLTPTSSNSGEATQRLGSITKEGSQVARFLLGQAVLHVLRADVSMREWYKRIRRRRGSKIARVAVMRRLATIIWHMLSREESYQRGGPPRERLPRRGAAARIADAPEPRLVVAETTGASACQSAPDNAVRAGHAVGGSPPNPQDFEEAWRGVQQAGTLQAPLDATPATAVLDAPPTSPSTRRRQRKTTAPAGVSRQEPEAPLAHRGPGYSLPGCVPAEPDAASPGELTISRSRRARQPIKRRIANRDPGEPDPGSGSSPIPNHDG